MSPVARCWYWIDALPSQLTARSAPTTSGKFQNCRALISSNVRGPKDHTNMRMVSGIPLLRRLEPKSRIRVFVLKYNHTILYHIIIYYIMIYHTVAIRILVFVWSSGPLVKSLFNADGGQLHVYLRVIWTNLRMTDPVPRHAER